MQKKQKKNKETKNSFLDLHLPCRDEKAYN